MRGLVRLVPAQPTGPPAARLWLVFFMDSYQSWWSRLFRPGFRHVCAAAWFADTQRWVLFDPVGTGTLIEVATDEEFGPRFEQLVARSSAILRMASREERRSTPAVFYCVGAIKGLLGVKSRALSPLSLYRHLRSIGAEPVPRPNGVDLGLAQQSTPASSVGRSSDYCAAEG